ncbi:MAG: hypothetical protein M1358_18505 [Chloroflexi bacterium]|nr:hypothetical protein [Chloroflexota bacterium]
MRPRYSPQFAEAPVYDDRYEAGGVLAGRLMKYRRRRGRLVLAISGPGVEVALPIAQALHASLDLVIPTLLPIPQRPESSFGAVLDDTIVVNDGLAANWGLGPDQIRHIARDVWDAAVHRMRRLRGDERLPDPRGKIVIFADDGLGLGFPILAAVEWASRRKAREIVVALPVAPKYDLERLIPLVSEVVCPVQSDAWNLYIASFFRRWQKPTDEQLSQQIRLARMDAAG